MITRISPGCRRVRLATLDWANDHSLLSRAFELADEARRDGDHPFGALPAVDGEIVADRIAAGTLDMTNQYWQ